MLYLDLKKKIKLKPKPYGSALGLLTWRRSVHRVDHHRTTITRCNINYGVWPTVILDGSNWTADMLLLWWNKKKNRVASLSSSPEMLWTRFKFSILMMRTVLADIWRIEISFGGFLRVERRRDLRRDRSPAPVKRSFARYVWWRTHHSSRVLWLKIRIAKTKPSPRTGEQERRWFTVLQRRRYRREWRGYYN